MNSNHWQKYTMKVARWSQFVTLMMAQLSGRNSLRDIVENMTVQAHHLYHLGSEKLSRSNLSRMNNDKPYTLYEALFWKLLARCQPVVPRHKFRFKNLLYSLDASTIDLCLGMFPWADSWIQIISATLVDAKREGVIVKSGVWAQAALLSD